MAENAMEQIVSTLRQSGAEWYPQRSELRNVRVVGHTPKADHYIYDTVLDFMDGSERLAVKVYRVNKCGSQAARSMASQETDNLKSIYALGEKKKLRGIPRPLGDFAALGAVVSEKLCGIPVQSIIMKAALLPGYADRGTLQFAARSSGEWLRKFHKATADMPEPFDPGALLRDVERLCADCRGEGLDELSVKKILNGTRQILARSKKSMPSSAVLNDFTPLNVIIGENGVGFADFSQMAKRGSSFHDVATLLASVEALEKYPFCNRAITAEVQSTFLDAYGASASELQVLRVLKMKALLGMLVHGRTVKDNAVRKKVMWANVMTRFIQQAAERALAPAA